jgi:hypothetical protein
LFSPTDFENKYVAVEQRAYDWLGQDAFAAMKSAAALALCGYIYWIQKFIQSNQTDVTNELLYILPYISRGIYVIVLSSLALIHLSERALKYALPALCLILSLYSNYVLFSGQHLGELLWLPMSFTPLILVIAGLYITLKKFVESEVVAFAIYTAAHFGWVAFVLFHLEQSQRLAIISYLFGFKCVLFWFWVSVRSRSDGLSIAELSNPLNALRGWPWPKQMSPIGSALSPKKNAIWWNGIFNLFLGYTLLALATALLFHFRESFQKIAFNYALHILIDIATLNLIPGCARVFGFNFFDATYFVFLAKSPGEVWRRGSVYNFKFNQEFVFWPTLRFFKNYWVALFLAFSMFYLNSLTFESVMTLAGRPTSEFEGKIEAARALSFFLYFLIICIPSRHWRFPTLNLSQVQRQWLSVAATHVTNLAVLYIVYGLAINVLSP